MKTFQDNLGHPWIVTVTVNVDAVKRVRNLLNVNLLEVAEGKLLERLANDPVLLCDVPYVLIKPDADKRNVSDEEFGRAMGGDAILQATEALLEELVDFFPQPKRRLLRTAREKLKSWEAQAPATVEEKLAGPELQAQVENALKSFGNSSGNSPELSASTPAR
jgi:hypothetical protein